MGSFRLFFPILFGMTLLCSASDFSWIADPPVISETMPGSTVVITISLTNSSDRARSYSGLLELPEGWESFPSEETQQVLGPGENTVLWLVFRVPRQALEGKYSIRYSFFDTENSSCIEAIEWSVPVAEKHAVSGHLDPPPRYIRSGRNYEFFLTISNEGNTEEEIFIDLPVYDDIFLIFDAPSSFSLSPFTSKRITFTLRSLRKEKVPFRENIAIHIVNKNNSVSPSYFIVDTEIIPIPEGKPDLYCRLPTEVTIGYGKKNEKTEGFIEQKGIGPLDGRKNLDFFFRIPVIKQADIDRDLGGLPENGYVHLQDPAFDVYGGDGVYTLTPLTLFGKFGKGASFAKLPDRFGGTALYVCDTSSIPGSVWGGSVSYLPIPSLTFSVASLINEFPKHSEKIYDTGPKSFTGSFSAIFKEKSIGTTQIELAATAPVFSKRQQGYYLSSGATLLPRFWYVFRQIYAEPDFVGYYRNTAQSNATVGFPLMKKLQGTVSYNRSRYNFRSSKRGEPGWTTCNVYGGLSYSFPFGLYLSSYGNYLSSEEKYTDFGYRTRFLSLNGGKTWAKWTLQGMLELGRYTTFFSRSSDRLWENGQISFYFQPSSRNQYSVYFRNGIIRERKKTSDSQIYGCSLSRQFGSFLQLRLIYQMTTDRRNRQYIGSDIRYTFPGGSRLECKGYWNRNQVYSSTLEFLCSYTLPWNVPFKKNRSVGHLQGKVEKYIPGEDPIPYSGLLVNCSGKRTLTDEKGNFLFSDLTPGIYSLTTEGISEGMVSSVSLPRTLSISGGEVTSTSLQFEHPGRIEGVIYRYGEDESISPTGFGGILIVAVSGETEEQQAVTDEKGRFILENLPSGRWTIKIHSKSLPSGYRSDPEEITEDLFPATTRFTELKLIPIKRSIHIIDSGSISYEVRP